MAKERRDPKEFLEQNADIVRDLSEVSRSFRDFDRLTDGLDVEQWRRSKALISARASVRRLVAGYAELVPSRAYAADARVFGRSMAGPAVQAIRVLALALVTPGERFSEKDVASAVRLVLGGDPASQSFRAALTGLPWTGDPLPGDGDPFPPPFGDDRIPPDKLDAIACAVGLGGALTTLGVAGATAVRPGPYPGMTITGLAPRSACAGEVVHVSGTGFGATQPADAVVLFGSVRATIVAGSWGPTGFDVVVPDVGECCVSILQIQPQTGEVVSLSTALSELAGVLSECFGNVGIALGGKLEQIGGRSGFVEEATCAPDGSNRFVGGGPRIRFFRTPDGTASPQHVRPGQAVVLSWSITNAASATLTITPPRGHANSPFAHPPTLPAWFTASATDGSVTLAPPTGLVPWRVTAILTAQNRCGVASAAIELEYAASPGLVFVGGGAKSSFHLGAIEALGAMPIASPVVCAGSGLGALSAVCAAADYPAPASLRTFWDGATGHDAWYATNQGIIAPGGDFAALNTAIWQAENRAEVLTLGALDLQRRFLVPYRPNDARVLEQVIAYIAGWGADAAMDALDDLLKTALKEAGQSVLGVVPIVNIIYAAEKFAIAAFVEHLKHQTTVLLETQASMYDDAPLKGLVATALTGVTARLAASGRKVRIPITSLELGRARYGTEGAAISDVPVLANIVTNVGAIASIVSASAAVPLLGRPVKLGSDNYVDGSVRDPAPIGAAVEAGAEIVIVLQPNNRLIAREETFDAAGLPLIDGRVAEARDAQFLDAAVEPFGRFGRDVNTREPIGRWRAAEYLVEPSVQIVGLGATFCELGLVNIMADYGYMRTYDALVPWILFPDPNDDTQSASRRSMIAQLTASTDKIVGLRVSAWELEHALNGMVATPRGPTNHIGGGPLVALPQSSAIDDIRAKKQEIRSALVARLALPGPFVALASQGAVLAVEPIPKPRAEMWYLGWEAHSFDFAVSPTTPDPLMPLGDPWVGLSWGGSGAWTVAAATPPASLPWP